MTISREQVADLQPGDVVDIVDDRYPGVITRGPLSEDDHGCVVLGRVPIKLDDGSLSMYFSPIDRKHIFLTVVSRAPRPLYVNHPRTSPVPGDVVRAEDSDDPMRVWLTSSNEDGDIWWVDYSAEWVDRGDLPDRLRLLVDGETGQVVQ